MNTYESQSPLYRVMQGYMIMTRDNETRTVFGRNPLFIGSCSDIDAVDVQPVGLIDKSQSPLYRVMQGYIFFK